MNGIYLFDGLFVGLAILYIVIVINILWRMF